MSTFFEKPFFANVRQLKEPRPLVESRKNKERDRSQQGNRDNVDRCEKRQMKEGGGGKNQKETERKKGRGALVTKAEISFGVVPVVILRGFPL